jgi:hypothetical protein
VSYDRHTDSAPIEQWLVKRGFVNGTPGEADPVDAAVLEDA